MTHEPDNTDDQDLREETTAEILSDHLARIMPCLEDITPSYVEDRLRQALADALSDDADTTDPTAGLPTPDVDDLDVAAPDAEGEISGLESWPAAYDVLEAARREAEEIEDAALTKAAKMLSDAHERAEQIVADAQETARQILDQARAQTHAQDQDAAGARRAVTSLWLASAWPSGSRALSTSVFLRSAVDWSERKPVCEDFTDDREHDEGPLWRAFASRARAALRDAESDGRAANRKHAFLIVVSQEMPQLTHEEDSWREIHRLAARLAQRRPPEEFEEARAAVVCFYASEQGERTANWWARQGPTAPDWLIQQEPTEKPDVLPALPMVTRTDVPQRGDTVTS